MTLPKLTPTAIFKPASGGTAKQLVIILHGWGADGHNLIDLADMLGQYLPDALFIAPNAPYVCEVNPFGFQWFSLMDRNPEKMLKGARLAADILNSFIDEQLAAHSLNNDSFALVGFSQGTMLGLHVSLRRLPKIAAFVGFSGALVGAENLANEVVAKPPICLIHGQIDDVVPYASMQHAKDNLSKVEIKVETYTRAGLGHSIDFEGIKIAGEFLQKSFRL